MGWWGSAGVSEDAKLDGAQTRRVLRRTAGMIRPYRNQALLALALLLAFSLASMAGPLLVRRAIDGGLVDNDAGVLNTSIGGYVAAAIASYLTFRWAIATLARVGENFLRDLRVRVFKHLLNQSMPFYDRENAGVLVSRMTSDVDSLQVLVQMGLLMFVAAGLVLSASIVTLLVLDPLLLVLCLLTMPFVAGASVWFHRTANRAYLSVREHVGFTLTQLQEGISGVRVVQAFAREQHQIDRFDEANDGLYRAHMRSVKIGAMYLPVVELAGAVSTALAIGIGGTMAIDGRLTIGTLTAFILILQTMFGPVQQLSQLFNMVQSATASLHKLYELMDEPPVISAPVGASPLPPSGHVELEGVGFHYVPGEPVLQDIDLTIADGERIALVGPTGAGKSTVAKLVARFYDPTNGTIRIGGMPLKEAELTSLRDRIVVVPQEGFLFAGTVADNIRLAKPGATDDELVAALDRIGVADVFARLPDGMATEVQERGSRLSAGEKQLVSLARAALVDPSILVLDEATSSVDPGTEALVETAMESLMAERTVIVIAHRLSTSQRCDRVGVIDDGRLVELDTHDALVAADGHYSKLYEAWTAGLAA